MELTFEQIKDISLGAVSITQNGELVEFDRFTAEQRELYKRTYEPFYLKSLSTSGVKLMFTTDSETLTLDINSLCGESRTYFAFDVTVDGKLIGTINNYSNVDLSGVYCWGNFPLGDYTGEFSLGEGTKQVCIYFPWSVRGAVRRICLDDGSFVKASRPSKRIVMYGDSITHGYDALNPSMSYAERFSRMMDAEVFNKAIGGERFFPALSKLSDSFIPDFVTVAYGTNDWSNDVDYPAFTENCRAFYTNLAEIYKGVPIFAITPIWRADYEESRKFGSFLDIPDCIQKATEKLDSVTVIQGFDLVPEDTGLYADLRLHPNNEGFEHYASNLFCKVSERLR